MLVHSRAQGAGRISTRGGHVRLTLRHIDPWLVAGSSLYWSEIALRMLGMWGRPVHPAQTVADPFLSAASYLVMVAAIFAAYLAMRRGPDGLAGTRGLSAAVVVMTLPSLVPHGDGAAGALAMAFDLSAIGLFMIMWGTAFVSLDKRAAAFNAAAATLLTTLVTLASLLAYTRVSGLPAGPVLAIASACILATGKVRLENVRREPAPEGRRPIAAFTLERLAFGVLLGFAGEVEAGVSPVPPAADLAAVSAISAVLLLAVCVRNPRWLYAALPAMVLAAPVLQMLPFGGMAPGAVGWSGAMVVWTAWCAFSAVQLSEYKERLSMSELGACLLDKVALGLAIALGHAAFGLLQATSPAAAGTRAMSVLLTGLVLLAVMYTAVTVASLVDERKEDETRRKITKTKERRLRELYDWVAEEYALSAREREVMEMLAEGHTSSFIQDELGVSQGTAKAHIAHIYQKLDIHRKDDLLQFIHKLESER